jgi:hypothetical protein
LAHRQITVGLGQVADEFMAQYRAGLSAYVFTGCDMQVAATNPRVRDVYCHPARMGFRHRNGPDGHDIAAFPDQRVLLRHGIGPPCSALGTFRDLERSTNDSILWSPVMPPDARHVNPESLYASRRNADP